MTLERLLPEGCSYTPADQNKWNDRVIEVDLDKGEFPPGRYDVITALGLLEYLHDPLRVLCTARDRARRLIVTYCIPQPGVDVASRRERRWINDYSEDELRRLVESAGWAIERCTIYKENERIREALLVAV